MKDKNMQLRTATCSICGPVKINHAGRCRNAVNKDKRKGKTPRSGMSRTAKVKYVRQAKAKPCMDCGIMYPYYVMDLDHREPFKKFRGVSNMMRFPIEKIQAEIDKCDVVCANCHRERTWGNKKRPTSRG
jgi:hypothetical protein